jgi:hypothetical protein
MNDNLIQKVEVSFEELESFRADLEAALRAYHQAQFSNLICPSVEVQVGQKYARIVRKDTHSNSAHCFVNLGNGDILKPATWKGPAKGMRGNIRWGNSSNWWNGSLGPYGTSYLR